MVMIVGFLAVLVLIGFRLFGTRLQEETTTSIDKLGGGEISKGLVEEKSEGGEPEPGEEEDPRLSHLDRQTISIE